MAAHMSSLFSFGAHSKSSTPQTYVSFSLRSAPWDPTKILVHPSGHPVDAPPMYSITISETSTPNVMMSRGWGGGPWDIIGDARLPTFSSKCHLTIQGQSMILRLNELSGSFAIESPTNGKLKWRLDMSMRNLELRDPAGTKLAEIHSGKAGEKIVDILVPHDSRLLDLVLLSGLTARMKHRSEMEAAGEILSGILGA
jgi:hypothetical protein